MRELTEHEQQQDAAASEQARRAAKRTEQQDLRRLCPVNSYVDTDHLLALMRQGPSGNRPFLLWRHFAAVGMRYAEYSREQIAEALGVELAKLSEVLLPLKEWEVPLDVKRRFPLLYPGLVVREPSTLPTPAHRREDYPFAGTSGWRTEGPMEPGIRTRTLGGNTPVGQK